MDYVTIEDLPPHFYKYRSLATSDAREFARQIIGENQLYWPSPLDFNDPFDCAPVHEMRAGKLKRELKIKKIVRKGMPHATKQERAAIVASALRRPDHVIANLMQTMQRELMKTVGVCSLATSPRSVLMWSHYADSHRGICLRFRCAATYAASRGEDSVAESDLHFEFALPVSYSDARPVISILDEVREQNVLQKALLTKAKYWEYEGEWRMIAYRDGPGPKSYPAKCLDAIILGAQISDEHREMIQDWNAQRDEPAELLQATFDDKLFQLNIRSPNKLITPS